jgi:hypothetical protein
MSFQMQNGATITDEAELTLDQIVEMRMRAKAAEQPYSCMYVCDPTEYNESPEFRERQQAILADAVKAADLARNRRTANITAQYNALSDYSRAKDQFAVLQARSKALGAQFDALGYIDQTHLQDQFRVIRDDVRELTILFRKPENGIKDPARTATSMVAVSTKLDQIEEYMASKGLSTSSSSTYS